MCRRLVHNTFFNGLLTDKVTKSKAIKLCFFVTLSLLSFTTCSLSDNAESDRLNSQSYYFHYRDIDSVEVYARRAFDAATHDGQRAEALNNLAFAAMTRMNYGRADSLLQQIQSMTDHHVELLVAEVQYMRLCQRRSSNRAFYEHRERALSHIARIDEDRSTLSSRMQERMVYAESEMAIVNSTYYYYVGLERQSIEALEGLNVDEVRHDTAQYLNYLYNVGAGGILTDGTEEEILQLEMDLLHRCLNIARRQGFSYFEAQAKEAIAEHTGNLQEAEESLDLFRRFGDVYQIAGAYRTVASCYHGMGDDMRALEMLHMALADQRINQAPDLVASIREQLSVAYAAINDKQNSDKNRNIYIDLQEQTRQDRELEARASMLDHAVGQLNVIIWAVMGVILLLLFVLWLFNRQNRKEQENHYLDNLLEEKKEEVAEARLRVEQNERRCLEQRAKVSMAMGILPLIDRILHSVGQATHSDSAKQKNAEMDYVRELTDNIIEQNDRLTQWIKLRQGELNLHIETFSLQSLFDIVAHGRASFLLKGVNLCVESTTASVKADRVLTLFMLNTLADNARKFTERGGQVTVSATETDGYVEVSVTDTGRGLTAEQLEHVFNHTVTDNGLHERDGRQSSHGFGLMNCRGIIEKYRKLSRLFSVCLLSAESEVGHGSRFFFRLPKGVLCGLLTLLLVLTTIGVYGRQTETPSDLDCAHVYADSAYFSNINGTYERTLAFADSCRTYLNAYYLKMHPGGTLLLTCDGDMSVTPPEISWLHDNVDTNYEIILDIRNESAVAALALHEWHLYAYNNKVYTQLFKELSADSTLDDYCRTMQRSQTNKRIAVVLLLVLLFMIVPAYYMIYYRHRLYRRFQRERQQQMSLEMSEDELRRAELENANLHVANAVLDNCLSTLKHETMYYPSRIRQLIDTEYDESLVEVAAYYRELYGILIRQAMSQVERIRIPITSVTLCGQRVLGNENLLCYLFELITGERQNDNGLYSGVSTDVRDDRYVVFHIPLATRNPMRSNSFTFLLCRQIIREHGEATNRLACGITMDSDRVDVVLPRANMV